MLFFDLWLIHAYMHADVHAFTANAIAIANTTANAGTNADACTCLHAYMSHA